MKKAWYAYEKNRRIRSYTIDNNKTITKTAQYKMLWDINEFITLSFLELTDLALFYESAFSEYCRYGMHRL